MATLEEKLANQIEDALSDKRFRVEFLPPRIAQLPFVTQEELAVMIIYILDYWSVQYRYNTLVDTPERVGEFANILIDAYREWKAEQ